VVQRVVVLDYSFRAGDTDELLMTAIFEGRDSCRGSRIIVQRASESLSKFVVVVIVV